MNKERNYLIETLKESGVKSRICTSLKELHNTNEIRLGAVLRINEKFTRSNSKKYYIDQAGKKRLRNCLFERKTTLKVVIADSTEERVEEILNMFLQIIHRGLEVDGNWVEISIGDTDWVDKDDSILKSNIAVEFPVEFAGGVYIDTDVRKIGVGTIKAEIGGTDGSE